jgi:hypothetical protein
MKEKELVDGQDSVPGGAETIGIKRSYLIGAL